MSPCSTSASAPQPATDSTKQQPRSIRIAAFMAPFYRRTRWAGDENRLWGRARSRLRSALSGNCGRHRNAFTVELVFRCNAFVVEYEHHPGRPGPLDCEWVAVLEVVFADLGGRRRRFGARSRSIRLWPWWGNQTPSSRRARSGCRDRRTSTCSVVFLKRLRVLMIPFRSSPTSATTCEPS
jgi:hypothetical protein